MTCADQQHCRATADGGGERDKGREEQRVMENQRGMHEACDVSGEKGQ